MSSESNSVSSRLAMASASDSYGPFSIRQPPMFQVMMKYMWFSYPLSRMRASFNCRTRGSSDSNTSRSSRMIDGRNSPKVKVMDSSNSAGYSNETLGEIWTFGIVTPLLTGHYTTDSVGCQWVSLTRPN